MKSLSNILLIDNIIKYAYDHMSVITAAVVSAGVPVSVWSAHAIIAGISVGTAIIRAIALSAFFFMFFLLKSSYGIDIF